MEVNTKQKQHIYELDYIRAISAIFIVLYHYTTRYDTSIGHLVTWPIGFPWGCWAVNTFFLLTGYLTLRNFREGGLAFAFKRFARLWPAFAVCVVITSVFMAVLMPERLRSVGDILLNFTMFPTYLGAEAVDGVYWTLPLEILFYFWIMLFMVGKKEKRAENFLLVWACMAAAVNLCDRLGITPLPIKLLRIVLICERAPCFILGAALHLYHERKWEKWITVALCILGTLVAQGLAVCLWTTAWAALIWAVVTGKLSFAPKNSNILHKSILFLSGISYTLYLLHQFIGFAIIQKIEQMGAQSELWIFLPMAVSVILATAVHYAVELPVSDWLLKLGNTLLSRYRKEETYE